jgi:hypothetical protein
MSIASGEHYQCSVSTYAKKKENIKNAKQRMREASIGAQPLIYMIWVAHNISTRCTGLLMRADDDNHYVTHDACIAPGITSQQYN